MFIFLNLESLITNNLLADNSEPVEIYIQEDFIPINSNSQQMKKMNISGKKPLVL